MDYTLKKTFRKKLKMLLGFTPGNIFLYQQAFTHKSMASQSDTVLESNERLEFLGDTILDAVVAHYIFKKYPNENEGFLTKLKSKIVSRTMLNNLGRKIGLQEFITYKDRFSATMIGNAFEALIGAVFLDKGFDKTEKFIIQKILIPYINTQSLLETVSDYKSKLVEYTQQNKLSYRFEFDDKSSKRNTYYLCWLFVDDKEVSKGEGRSKKIAEQDASRHFFEKIIMAKT